MREKERKPVQVLELRGKKWCLWPDGTITTGDEWRYTGMRLPKPHSQARLRDKIIKEEIAALKRELH